MKKSFKTRRSPAGAVLKIRAEKNGLGSIKTLLVLFSIFLQFCMLFFLYYVLAEVFNWYIILSLVLSVIACIYTLLSDRSPSSKAIWVFIILICFYVGYLLCLLSDERYFFRRPRRRYRKVFARAEQFKPQSEAPKCYDKRVEEDCSYLSSAGKFPVFTGSGAQYFPSGGLFFDDVLARIAQAEKFVFLEFFIIADGVVFERAFKLLSEKARNGVDVFIIFDDMGSHRKLSARTKKRMRECGIKIMSFNRLIPVIDIGLNYRDHRKIVVVDGKAAYTGGINLADEYTNDTRMYGYWKDGGVRVDGRAVDGFTYIFLRQWEYLTRKSVDYTRYMNNWDQKENSSLFVPFSDGLDIDVSVGKETYLNVIAKAQGRLYIMTPYLVPDDSIMNMLINKAACGTDVRIILPEIPDKTIVYQVTLNNAQRLAARGVKIYLMRDSFVHSKVLLSDYCAVIGTINVDMRSFFQQFESALYTNDSAVLRQVETDFEKTFAECRELSDRDKPALFSRALAGVLKIISPLM